MLLPEFGVKQPVTNLMIFLGIVVLGIISILFLPVDLMPEMEMPAITVITNYPGAAAEDVETAVTKPIENDLSIISNLTEINSYSREGVSYVVCRFNWGTNLDEASNEIRNSLDFTKMNLPDDANKPIIVKFNTNMMPILFYGVTAKESWTKLYDILDDQLVTSLKQIEGVGAVQLIGGLQRQINIEIDKGKLVAYGISINEVEGAIRLHNYSLPAGSLKIGSNEYMLQTPGEYKKLTEIEETIIRVAGQSPTVGNMQESIVGQNNTSPIRLRDIAIVRDDFKDPSGMVYIDGGESGILFFIQKQSGANTNEITQKIIEKLEVIKKRLPADIKFAEIFNTADMINTTISNLNQTVFFGGILVIIITLLFLGEIRSSLIIVLTIPFSLISAFIFLYIWGKTINMMSLASIAIAIGMVVDNAIVVMENIFTHRARGSDQFKSAIIGTSEVGLAISASALTTVVVFVPLIFLTGITGIIFKQLGVMIIVTIMASLITALTFTPMLASRILSSKSSFDKKGWFIYVEKWYASILDWALAHKTKVVVIAIIIFMLSISLIPFMGTEFFPEQDTGEITITAELPAGKRMEESLKIGRELEKIFREVSGKDLLHSYIRTGTVGLGGAMMGVKEGINVVLVGGKVVKSNYRKRSDKKIAQEVRQKITRIPGLVKFDVATGDHISQGLMGGGKALTIEIFGNDMEKTDNLAVRLNDVIAKIPGIADPSISRDIAKPEWKIRVDNDKAASFGMNKNFIANTIRTYFYGNVISKYREGGKEYDIFIRLQPKDRQYFEDVTNAFISNAPGQTIPISAIAKINEELGPIEIERKNQTRIVKVSSNIYQRPLGDVAKDVEKEISKIALPEGISIKIAGLFEEQQKSFRDLGFLLLLSIFLVYAVMASQFESLLHPFIILFSVPFGFSGVFIGLFLRGYPISMVSLLGLVLLVGVVVNNAIVLVDYINLLRRSKDEGGYGLGLLEAVREAGIRRLRPIMMTTLTTVFGLLPMVLQTGEGTESWRPLGTTILSGLLFSTMVTLVLVPVIYIFFNKKSNSPAN